MSGRKNGLRKRYRGKRRALELGREKGKGNASSGEKRGRREERGGEFCVLQAPWSCWVLLRKDSEELEKFLGKWNRKMQSIVSHRLLNTVTEQFTARCDGHQGGSPQCLADGKTGKTGTSLPGQPLLPWLFLPGENI